MPYADLRSCGKDNLKALIASTPIRPKDMYKNVPSGMSWDDQIPYYFIVEQCKVKSIIITSFFTDELCDAWRCTSPAARYYSIKSSKASDMNFKLCCLHDKLRHRQIIRECFPGKRRAWLFITLKLIIV